MTTKRFLLLLFLVPLATIGGCLGCFYALMWWGSWDRPIATFDLGDGRKVVVIEEGGWQEIMQPIHYHIEENGVELARGLLDMVDLSTYPQGTDYMPLTAGGNQVVAIVKESYHGHVLLLCDFAARRCWQDASCKRYLSDDADAFMEAARLFMREHPDFAYRFAGDGSTWAEYIAYREDLQRVPAPSPKGDSQ